MALQIPIKFHQFAFRRSSHPRVSVSVSIPPPRMICCVFAPNSQCFSLSKKQQKLSSDGRVRRRSSKLRASSSTAADNEDEDDEDEDGGPSLMTAEERYEWRSKIRHVMDTNPDDDPEDDEEVEDLVEKRRKMQKLLADYPLVVDEEDPDWPEDADGRGFNLDQFFNKITIKNVNKKKKNNDNDDDDDDEENDNELVWQDDDYIRAIKDITTPEWEEAVFKDISPLIVLLHHRYKRPKENEKFRDELEKAVQIIWNCRLPSPRCVAVDAVVEVDLVSALKVSVFPEMIFTKAGKILYREKAHRTADELSKIMAFFYYGASKPPCLNGVANFQEAIPSVPVTS